MGVAVSTGSGEGVAVAGGGATISCNGALVTTTPSAANVWTVTP